MSAAADKPDRPHQHRPGSDHDSKLLRRLLTFAGPYRWAIAATILLLIIGLVLQVVGPEIFQRVLDGPVAEAARTRGTPAFDSESLTDQVVDFALLFLAVALVQSILAVVREWLMHRTGQGIVFEIRNRLFGHVLRLPVSWFDRHHVGWAVTRSTSDVDALSEMFTTGVSTIIYDLLKIVVLIGALIWIAPSLSLVALGVLPVMVYVSFRFRLVARRAYRATRESLSRLNAFLQERLTGLDVVRLFRRERSSKHRFDKLNTVYYDDNMVTVRHFSLFFPTVDTLANAIKIGTLVFGAWLITEGSITVGVLVQYWFYLSFVFDPIRELAERYNILQAAMAAAERIFGIFDTPTETQAMLAVATAGGAPAGPEAAVAAAAAAAADEAVQAVASVSTAPAVPAATAATAEAAATTAPSPLVEFEHVSFSYPVGPPVLHDLSFTINRGERVAVVGHTGAGKTTLVSLLCRFHETPQGTIRFDGRDIESIPHRDLRRRIAIVQQDVFLFSDTIAANIRMGNPDLPLERVREVARAVHADKFIERMEAGYESGLRERGSNLSSGQRQLVAFARALAADPELLVLDEATSSVDSETEHLIEDATKVLLQGRTSLIIAHRLSTVVAADRILVMHKGELREQGSHAELMAQGGLYSKLFKLHLAAAP